MPTSRTRTRKPAAAAGIPGDVLALAPRDWSPVKRAMWCRAYMDGRAGHPYRSPDQDRFDRLPPLAKRKAVEDGDHWARSAHRQGRNAASRTLS